MRPFLTKHMFMCKKHIDIEGLRSIQNDRNPGFFNSPVFPPATGGYNVDLGVKGMDNNKGACNYPLDKLVDVMARLRGSGGCPWDQEQTHQSLTPYLVEETYEVLEALVDGQPDKVCDELGDLLLQIIFHAQIAKEEKNFDINDVVVAITEKMIRRHPHVFGSVEVANSAEVLVNWDKIKNQEQGGQRKGSLLGGIPKGLPALNKAHKLQVKAAQVGFDWPDYHGALDKLDEELTEFKTAIDYNNRDEMYRELGDILFAVVNVARLLDIDPEGALASTNNKFIQRFQYIEQQGQDTGTELQKMTLKEMDYWWNKAKCLETQKKGKNIK